MYYKNGSWKKRNNRAKPAEAETNRLGLSKRKYNIYLCEKQRNKKNTSTWTCRWLHEEHESTTACRFSFAGQVKTSSCLRRLNRMQIRVCYDGAKYFTHHVITIVRDVDKSRKPGKLPGCERDFSGCKALLLSPKCFQMLSEDCYLFISFVYIFIAVLPELKGLY